MARILVHQLTFNSRRSEYATGYLEFIWPTNLNYEGMPYDDDHTPQAIATISDVNDSGPLMYAGVFGRFTCWGHTVAECKESLFPVIQNHFNEYGTVYGLA